MLREVKQKLEEEMQRIEYELPDARWEHDDIEVTTAHYRGAHGASVARSGTGS